MRFLILHVLVEAGGYFPSHFLYAWLAKNFNAYELAGEASSSPGMVKFSGLSQAKSFLLEGAFASIHPSSTDLRRLS